MHLDLSSFNNWFVGAVSGISLTEVFKLIWNRWTQTSDRVRMKKDAIGHEFNKLYLEGKGHGFRKPPKDQDHFRKVIFDVDKYDKKLSHKLALCRSNWSVSALRKHPKFAPKGFVHPIDLKTFEDRRREAEEQADEVYEELKKKWII